MNLALRDFDSADFRDDADQDWTDLAISNEPDVAPKAPVRDLLLSDQRVNGSATMWIGGASSAAVPFADMVPGGIASLATIAVGSSVDVVVETIGDHDWYRVTLNAGTTYTIQTSFDGSGTDAFLNLRDSAGALILSDDDGGESNNSLISYTPTSTGTYFIDAGTFNNDTTGSFHLFVAAAVAPGDSVLGSIATAATLALGGTTNGNVDSNGDHDYYAITLTAGQTYIFRTAATTQSDTTDTTLTLRNAAGTQLLTNDDAGSAGFSAIRYTATATGTYYLDVGGFGSATGAFNLSAFTAAAPTLYTNDQIATQLTNGYWGGGSHHFNVAPGGSLTFNVQGLTVDGQALARAAVALWGDVTGIVFNEVAVGGQIVYDDEQIGAFASASFSNGITSSATVNVGTAWITTYGTALNTYSFQTYIHETGHALGLGHGGNYNGSADYSSDSLYLNDAWATTIMSYFDQTENTYFQALGFTRQFVETPMIADGIAVANLYGVNTLTRTGNTTYGFNNNSGRDIYNAALFPSIGYTIYDNGGTDTLDYSGFSQNQSINLNAETFSNIGARVGNVSIARGTVIENAIGGSGNDTITGNAAANVLTGGGGVDTLLGNAGNDRLVLGAGSAGSTVNGGADTDTLAITGSTSLVSLAAIEAIELSNGATLALTGTQFTDGLAFNSAITGTGAITINIDVANQALVATSMPTASTVSFTINGSSGVDVVKAAHTTNVINGGLGTDQLRGGNLADTIDGGGDGDKIIGWGGADLLTGGSGADQFRYLFATDSGTGAAADRITDFVSGSDKFDFRFLDSDPGTAGVQLYGLSYIGATAFHATGSAEIRYATAGADLRVELDLNGDGAADMHILLSGLGGQSVGSGDFLL